MTLALKDLQVLGAIRHLGKGAYAAEIKRYLNREAEGFDRGPWNDTAFYRCVRKLRKARYIGSRRVRPRHGERGPVRRVYRLTVAGGRELDKELERLSPTEGKDGNTHEEVGAGRE